MCVSDPNPFPTLVYLIMLFPNSEPLIIVMNNGYNT
jgi:hypothetical protein